jgi:hypothetical protein
MNLYARERNARSRILEAATVLARQQPVDVPVELSVVEGDRQTRHVKQLEATAQFMECLALENVQTGLSGKLGAVGYTSLAVLRQTSDEDLMALDGIGRKTVDALRKTLDPVKRVEEPDEVDDLPGFEEIVAELSEEPGDGAEG